MIYEGRQILASIKLRTRLKVNDLSQSEPHFELLTWLADILK